MLETQRCSVLAPNKNGTGKEKPVPRVPLHAFSARGKMLVVRGSAAAAPHMLVLVLAGQGAFAQNWPARGILSHLDHLRRSFDFGELLGFGGMFQRRQRRLTAGDDLRHLVEVSVPTNRWCFAAAYPWLNSRENSFSCRRE